MSQRTIVHAGALPQDTDLLSTQKSIQATFGQVIQALLGTSTVVDGFTCIPSSPAALTVQVTAGNLFQLVVADSASFGSLASDSTSVMKAAALTATQTVTGFTAPGTAGYSTNFLVEATFSESDSGSTVLSYYNAANPAVNLSGPANAGTAQNTQRVCSVSLAIKAGTPATTGSQTTPSVDSGYTPLFVVTVANGQATITASSIAVHPSAPFIPTKLAGTYAVDSGSANTVVATIAALPSFLIAGLRAQVKIAATNSGASTFNLNSAGAKSVVKKGTTGTVALAANDLVIGSIADLFFDGTSWQLLSR